MTALKIQRHLAMICQLVATLLCVYTALQKKKKDFSQTLH